MWPKGVAKKYGGNVQGAMCGMLLLAVEIEAGVALSVDLNDYFIYL